MEGGGWGEAGKLDFQEVQLVGTAGEPGGDQDPSPRNFPLWPSKTKTVICHLTNPKPLSHMSYVSLVTLLMCHAYSTGTFDRRPQNIQEKRSNVFLAA